MGRRRITLPNKVLSGSLAAWCLLSCNAPLPKGALQLVQTVRISEPGSHVLHGLPVSIQLLDDSLAGIHFDATRYTIYNYYTGSIVGSPAPDSNVLPDLLRQARAYYPQDYQLIGVQEGQAIGVPVLSVEGIFYSKERRQYFQYITAAFAVDTFIEVRGATEPATAMHHVHYVAAMNRQFNTTGRYSLLQSEQVGPAFLYGGLVQEDRLLLPNIELAHIDSPGYGILCCIALQQGRGRVCSVPLAPDDKLRRQRKSHVFEPVSFADVNGQAYYVSDGRRIMYWNGHTFRGICALDSNEYVYHLYYNRSRKLLYVNTRFAEDALRNRIFTLDTMAAKPALIDSSRSERSVYFINDSLVLSLHKSPDHEHYAFSLYRY